MIIENIDKLKKQLQYIMLCTVTFGLMTHGYCYFNMFYSHDSIIVYQNDDVMDICVGRFLQPIYAELRGRFYVPTLVGLMSILFIGIAVYFVVHLFEIENKISVCLISGIMTVNCTVTLTNATYLHDADIYMLSLLMAVVSVYLFRNFRKWRWVFTPFVLMISMGLYQSFFQVAVFLMMMLLVKDILESKKQTIEILLDGVKSVSSLILGLALYYLVLQIVLKVSGNTYLDSYNSLSTVGKYESFSEIINLVKNTYKYVFDTMLNPAIHQPDAMGKLTSTIIGLEVLLVVSIVYLRKIRGGKLVLLILILGLMPLGMNIVYVISKGLVHKLMIYSFYFVYVYLFVLLDIFENSVSKTENLRILKIKSVLRWAASVLIAVIVFNSIIYANQIYLKKDLEKQTTLFTMTRIVDRMEQTEGYVAGETLVVFVGSLQESSISVKRMGFDYNQTGIYDSFSVTHYGTYIHYLQNILGYPVRVEYYPDGWSERPEVIDMPSFPENGCCKMIDDTMVVKLS